MLRVPDRRVEGWGEEEVGGRGVVVGSESGERG